MSRLAPWTRTLRLARALAERYGQWRAAPRPADLVLRRLPPPVSFRAWHRHTHLTIAPRFALAFAPGPRAGQAAEAPPLVATSPPPRADRVVGRLLMRTIRLESVQSVGRLARPGLAPAPPAGTPPSPRPAMPPVPRILPRARGTDAGDARRPEAEATLPRAPHYPQAPSPSTWPASHSPGAAPPIDIGRLTDRLVRELGDRVIAYRERLGRR
jgi:hypothetical protein